MKNHRLRPHLKYGIALATLLGVGAATGAAKGAAVGPDIQAGEIILLLQPGSTPDNANAIGKSVGAASVKPLLMANCYVLELDADHRTVQATTDAVAKIKAEAVGVRSVKASALYKLFQVATVPTVTPNDPLFSGQPNLPQINIPQAWAISQGGPLTVNVGWIDAGFDPTHEDAIGQFLPDSYNFVDNNTDITANGAAGSDSDHGTQTSGIAIANTNNGIGIAGIDWLNIKCVACKIQGKGKANLDGPALMNAYAYLLANKDKDHIVAVNMSYGALGKDPTDVNDPEYIAVKALADAGVIMVASAGNSSSDSTIQTPSGYPFVLSVSAVNAKNVLTYYSSFGKVELTAPGGEQKATDVIPNNDPDLDANGILMLSSQPAPKKYIYAQGTSFSAPHVTAVAALMMSTGNASSTEVIQALKDTANRSIITGALPDRNYGYGLLDAYAAMLRISVNVKILEPYGLDLNNQSNAPGGTQPPPVETFKPVFRFQVNNVPLYDAQNTVSALQIVIDKGTNAEKTLDIASLIASGQVQIVGAATAVHPSYTLVLRYQFPTTAPFTHTITVVGTNPLLATAAKKTETRAFTVQPHTFPSGVTFVSFPYTEQAADSPTGAFREAPQLLGSNVALFRWVYTGGSGHYAAYGGKTGNTDTAASFRPSDASTSTSDAFNPSLTANANPLGLGYFLIAPTAVPVITYGATYSTQVVRVPLHEGWNMIGDPYNYAVPLSTAILEGPGGSQMPITTAVQQNILVDALYTYDGQQYNSASVEAGSIAPWQGYWIYVLPKNAAHFDTQTVRTLVSTPTQQVSGATSFLRSRAAIARAAGSTPVSPAATEGYGGWKLQLIASAKTLTDSHNAVGMSTRATTGEDRTKTPKPPMMAPYVALGIARPNSSAGIYMQDLEPLGGQRTWKLIVDTDQANTDIVVSWPNIQSVPRTYRLMLVDAVTGQTVDMKHQSSYTFNSGRSAAPRELTLTARPANARSRALITNLFVNPAREGAGRAVSLYDIGYTVSQDVSLEASILTFNGREVATVSSNHTVFGGTNHLSWNGLDHANKPVHAGQYVVQLKAITPDGEVTRQVLLLNILR